MKKILQDSAKPAKGQQVITACAFIHRNFDGVEKLFVPKRAETKKFLPGQYEMPGGHIEFGEDIVDGLKREIMEELNMQISVGEPFCVFTYMNDLKGSQSIEVDYFAVFNDSIESLKINPAEHSEFLWISENELDKIASNIDEQEISAIKRGFEILKRSKKA